MTQQEGEVDDARQAGGAKHNKKWRSGQCKMSRWRMMQGNEAAEVTMQGNRVADNTTRRGGQRTRRNAIRQGLTQQEGEANDARQVGSGGQDKRKGAEDPVLRWTTTTCQKGRGWKM
jgi:hypothetical protein